MLCTTSPSAENLISNIRRNSAVPSAAELRAGIGSCSGTAEQFALDDAANRVRGDDMDLLNHRGLRGGRAEHLVAMPAHLVRAGPGEADGDQADLARRRQRLPIQQIARQELGSDVLGVARAAAVAGDEQLAPVAVGVGDDLGDCGYGGQELTVGERALERVARTLEMPGDFALASVRRRASHPQLRSHDVSRSHRLAAGLLLCGSALAPTLCSISA